MTYLSQAEQDKPVIWTVSMSRLSDLFRDITPEYDALATIEPIHLGFDEAVRHLRERLATERCDAVISAGSNAAYLKGRLPVPVVVAKASGTDMMRALARARRVSERIAVVTYQQPMPELAEFAATFGIDVAQRTYVTREDALAQVHELKACGIRAIVGAGLIMDLAEDAGLAGVFVYSSASIRQAFDDALEVARLAQLETGWPGRRRGRGGAAQDSPRARHGLADLRGESAAMEQVRQMVVLYARSNATVLIQGETGSGKELAAQAIHRAAPHGRVDELRRPFLAVNCGAIAESLLEAELFGHEEGAFTGARRGGRAGLFEAANGGTLFLDEIGEMPLPLQTRLLRVLEEREVVRVGGTRPVPVDVRIVSATHCDLAQRVRDGRFRADLFYRLAVLRLALPPLRERTADIVPLAEWLLRKALAALETRAQPNLQAQLQACAPLLARHAWPGNVRELRNLCERLALFLAAEPLQALTPAFVLAVGPELAAGAAGAAPPAEERATDVLRRFGGRRDAAAAYLGISRTTLWRRLRDEAGG